MSVTPFNRMMLKPLQTPVARLIDGICDRNRLSLNQLASMVFIGRSHLSYVRLGERTPSRELVLTMADQWPLTEDEKVELCTLFRVLPPGYVLRKDVRITPLPKRISVKPGSAMEAEIAHNADRKRKESTA